MKTASVIKTEENASVQKGFCYTDLTNGNITKNMQYQISPFYDETVPKSDPKYLAPVRKWEKEIGFVTAIRWTNAIGITIFHIIAIVFAIHILYERSVLWQSVVFETIWGIVGGFGVTGGAHRYWTHRSYKANIPVQMFLLFSFSVAGQNTIYDWVRDHRLHHKMSETSADPHDANRGFWFSHVGWLMMKKHPHVIREGRKIDMKDIINDPLVQFHTRYFTIFKILFCFAIPIIIPVLWGETWCNSSFGAIVRYACGLNFTWSVNSFAHIWGNKPYDKNIMPAENWAVSIAALGEGWHNYHHTFPWDYKAAELGYFFNITTFVIDFFALFGWVYDTKVASPSLIESVIKNRERLDGIKGENLSSCHYLLGYQ